MELGHVPSASIVGMIITMCIAVCVPVILLIVGKIKYKAKISSFFIGAGIFILFALILEQILHTVVISAAGGQEKFASNIWLYALYGGAAAAIFEETGRFIAMKFFMKNRMDRENTYMYGVGHGGIEAIIIVGFGMINNIITAIMINNNAISSVLALLDDQMRETTYQQISQLWMLPSYQFYLGGIERISAIALHIGFSFLMYQGVKFAEKKYICMAFGIHFLVDALTVLISNYLSVLALEVIVFAIAGCLIAYVYVINKDEEHTA